MNQLALAYGIAGLSAAIAIATVIGTQDSLTLADGPIAASADATELVADRRRARPRRVPVATEVAPIAAPIAPPADVQYVDEQGNPVDAPSARAPSRRGEEEEEEHEEEEGDDHDEHERREHRHEREEGDDD